MERCRWIWASALMALWITGCGSPQADSEGAAQPQASAPVEMPPPEKVVQTFLQAVKAGDKEAVGQLLTQTAKQKTDEYEMEVAPPGSATASFQVMDVEYVTEEKDGAHVLSTWTDVENGQAHTDNIIWVLRKEVEGWRIAGMIMRLFPDLPPLVLNFEDPEQMQREQLAAEQELVKRNTAPDAQATRPQDPAGSIQR